MSIEENTMTGRALCNVKRFVRNTGDVVIADYTELEVVETNADEIEFGFSSGKDRVYLRIRHADLSRLIREAKA